MRVAITSRVQAEITRAFPAAEASLVAAELAATELPNINNNGERVHLAVVKLSAGDLGQFRRHLALARHDWRDALAATGF